MNSLIQRLLSASRKFSLIDFVFFKITLVSIGLLLGAYFSRFFLGIASILWPVFIISYLWLMYRTFFVHMK